MVKGKIEFERNVSIKKQIGIGGFNPLIDFNQNSKKLLEDFDKVLKKFIGKKVDGDWRGRDEFEKEIIVREVNVEIFSDHPNVICITSTLGYQYWINEYDKIWIIE